ncbi:hypothetical protein P171DRAFT_482261 [Karstenula rhodostoma CBS 690.94]|uniref:Uncharacterized protein n=1 Tax=Karstenula rhodostoma CBS 690.94 TaxID=1392251 RepID=A0A9P4PNW2_9PLEO|nr:hypothetical protein P171DRAFT_482261 [Karstenula rhodostoma CBS 690.94]
MLAGPRTPTHVKTARHIDSSAVVRPAPPGTLGCVARPAVPAETTRHATARAAAVPSHSPTPPTQTARSRARPRRAETPEKRRRRDMLAPSLPQPPAMLYIMPVPESHAPPPES